MGLFWGHKKSRRKERINDAHSSAEVDQIKKETLDTAEEARRKAEELNKLLLANGISVQIHIATRGKLKRGH